jgi:hypothetical protein
MQNPPYFWTQCYIQTLFLGTGVHVKNVNNIIINQLIHRSPLIDPWRTYITIYLRKLLSFTFHRNTIYRNKKTKKYGVSEIRLPCLVFS